ncbi:MFS transporter [Streptomyces sp. KLMMK]|uniref:MFS transporter n=1 Tax=Streptomyces sp. KLMMK TaxID=3109353 RepID=UPI002FFF92B5
MITLNSARGRLVLTICCLATLMVGVDSTAVSVALPALERGLGASVRGMQWVIDAYNLVVASLMLLAGAMGDRFGRRRTLLAGYAVFTVGSALCGVASGLDGLIGFRVLQALGGAMLGPVSLSVITHTFTGKGERGRAIGTWSSTFGIGLAAGPLVGGALVAGDGWRSVFWANVPIGLVALLLTVLCLPESREAASRRADPVGQLLVVVLLGCLTYAVIQAPRQGWGTLPVAGALAAAAVALIRLVPYERRSSHPLIDPRFFRSLPFSGSVAVSLTSFAALGGFLLISSLYLQDVRGLSALSAGLWLLPMPVMTVLLAPVAGRLTGGREARLPLLLAGTAMGLAGLMCAAFHADESVVPLLVAYALFGAGIGLVDVPATALAVSGMPRSHAGVASGVTMATCRVGAALGVAVFGAVLSSGLHGGSPVGAGTAGFADAARPAWWIITGCGAAVVMLGALVTGRRAERSARETAVRLFPDSEPAESSSAPCGTAVEQCGRQQALTPAPRRTTDDASPGPAARSTKGPPGTVTP